MRPNKKETHRTRLTAGDDRINYPEDVGKPTADMTLVKIFFNSVISTKGARCIMLDVKDFYLNTPMKRFEYMRIKITDIPDKIIAHYKLHEIVTEDGYIYCEIRKGMYGLPQAGIIAQEFLQKRLAEVGYHQSKIVPGLWTHTTQNICFTLVVDNFAIKYTRKEDAQHFINELEKYYTISIDWDAKKYIGLMIDWDYVKRTVYSHMPGYLAKALQRSNIPHQQSSRTHLTLTLPQTMEPKYNITQTMTIPSPLTKKTRNTSKQWYGLYYIMDEQGTAQSSQHSARLQQNKPNPCRKQWR
jgi:hypothetical protein